MRLWGGDLPNQLRNISSCERRVTGLNHPDLSRSSVEMTERFPGVTTR